MSTITLSDGSDRFHFVSTMTALNTSAYEIKIRKYYIGIIYTYI
jgi:hypothetical protein